MLTVHTVHRDYVGEKQAMSADLFTERLARVRQRFAASLQTLKDWGFLSIDGDNIHLNREGLLQVDRLLHEFFLPQHRNARYA